MKATTQRRMDQQCRFYDKVIILSRAQVCDKNLSKHRELRKSRSIRKKSSVGTAANYNHHYEQLCTSCSGSDVQRLSCSPLSMKRLTRWCACSAQAEDSQYLGGNNNFDAADESNNSVKGIGSIIEGRDNIKDFALLQLDDIDSNIQSRRNR